MKTNFVAGVVWSIAATLLPSAVWAQNSNQPQQPTPQSRPQSEPAPAQVRRPYRGLFGAPADPSSKHALDLTLSTFAAYDDDVFAEQNDGGLVSDVLSRSGWFGGAAAGLAYSRPGDRVSLALAGEAGANRYFEQRETREIYRASGDVSFRLAERTRLGVAQSFVYAPQYRLGLFVSAASLTGATDPFITVIPDYDLFRLAAYRTTTEVSLSQGVGRRADVDVWYALADVNYVNEPYDYRSQAAGARYRQSLTRHLGLRLGYSYSEARYDDRQRGRRQRVHNIDAGVDYGRALSVSRRTTLTFSTGSAVLVHEPVPTPEFGDDVRYHIIGSAALNHELGRTWTAQLAFRRGVDFHEGFDDPFLSDAVSASLNGFFSRRLRFAASADYAIGSLGARAARNYHSASGTAGLEFALSRTVALYSRYIYYRYEFDRDLVLDPRFARSLDRQGVRFGLQASFPLIR